MKLKYVRCLDKTTPQQRVAYKHYESLEIAKINNTFRESGFWSILGASLLN